MYKVSVHAARLCTWVNRGRQLKSELQLAADMIRRQLSTKRITHYPIPKDMKIYYINQKEFSVKENVDRSIKL